MNLKEKVPIKPKGTSTLKKILAERFNSVEKTSLPIGRIKHKHKSANRVLVRKTTKNIPSKLFESFTLKYDCTRVYRC
jgi:hypothetical protein